MTDLWNRATSYRFSKSDLDLTEQLMQDRHDDYSIALRLDWTVSQAAAARRRVLQRQRDRQEQERAAQQLGVRAEFLSFPGGAG